MFHWQALAESVGQGLPAPETEHRFARLLKRQWRFDFAWPQQRVAVELEGGQFSRSPGRHQRGTGIEGDCEKYNAAVKLGWRVLRYTTRQIDRDPVGIVQEVADLLRAQP